MEGAWGRSPQKKFWGFGGIYGKESHVCTVNDNTYYGLASVSAPPVVSCQGDARALRHVHRLTTIKGANHYAHALIGDDCGRGPARIELQLHLEMVLE